MLVKVVCIILFVCSCMIDSLLAWFLVKSELINFVRNLEPTSTECEVDSYSLTFCDPVSVVRLQL